MPIPTFIIVPEAQEQTFISQYVRSDLVYSITHRSLLCAEPLCFTFHLNLGRQVISTTAGTFWLLTLRLVLITIGRMPAFSHSAIPFMTSARVNGGTSLSTANAELASELDKTEHPVSIAPVIAKLVIVGMMNVGLHGSGMVVQPANAALSTNGSFIIWLPV
jgi:hypothetical protein